jgi:short-subunit dehydrogenase
MKQRIKEIKSVSNQKPVEYMYIVADFSKMLTMDDYRNTIESKLRNLDVSMLILNAGMGAAGPFDKFDEVNVSNILTCNIMQTSYLPKLMAK